MILDSGERTVHPNGFQRDMHEGKGRMDLLPWRAIIEVSKHCEEGAKKYGERNIDKGCPQHSLIDSAMRHLAKYTIGMTDEDHLRACAWNILWALEQEVCRPDMQDIPARMGESYPSSTLESFNFDEMNEELDALSAKHTGAGYQSGIRRGVREAREIIEKHFGVRPSKLIADPPGKSLEEWVWTNCQINLHTPTKGGWEKIGEEDSPEPFRYGPEFTGRRCVEMTCFYNTDGICQSTSDRWDPVYGQKCPDFEED